MEWEIIAKNACNFYVLECDEGYPFGLKANTPVHLSLHDDSIRIEEQDVLFAKTARRRIESQLQAHSQKEENPANWYVPSLERKQELEEELQQHSLQEGLIQFSNIHAIMHEYNEEKEIKRVARKGVSVAGAIAGGISGPFSAIVGSTLGILLKKEIDEEACNHALLISFSLPDDETVYNLALSFTFDLSSLISLSELARYRTKIEFISKLLYTWDSYSVQNHESIAQGNDSGLVE